MKNWGFKMIMYKLIWIYINIFKWMLTHVSFSVHLVKKLKNRTDPQNIWWKMLLHYRSFCMFLPCTWTDSFPQTSSSQREGLFPARTWSRHLKSLPSPLWDLFCISLRYRNDMQNAGVRSLLSFLSFSHFFFFVLFLFLSFLPYQI